MGLADRKQGIPIWVVERCNWNAFFCIGMGFGDLLFGFSPSLGLQFYHSVVCAVAYDGREVRPGLAS